MFDQDIGNQERDDRTTSQKYIWPWMRMVCWLGLLLAKVPELIARKL